MRYTVLGALAERAADAWTQGEGSYTVVVVEVVVVVQYHSFTGATRGNTHPHTCPLASMNLLLPHYSPSHCITPLVSARH